MHYLIREEFWALGDDFNILDEKQQPVFHIDGVAFSWGDKLSFQDMRGNELACIDQKLLSFMPIQYGAPPCPTDFSKVLTPFESAGFKLIKKRSTVPFLSSDNLLMFCRT